MTESPISGLQSAGSSTDDRQVLWIDWGRHLRTRTLVRRLGIELVEIQDRGPRMLRYVRSMWRTWKAVRRRHPRVIIATNPSIALGYFLLVLRSILGFKLVSDAHYLGVQALTGGGSLQQLLDFYNRRVDLVIVTNDNHARRLQALGARPFVCPDPLPEMAPGDDDAPQLPEKSTFLVCSFDIDEPYLAAIEAFRQLSNEGHSLYVSGDHARAGILAEAYPWVRFLGFVPEARYYAYLRASSVIMDLTEYDNCLVCGAYEALALRKALVLSNSSALRAYFGGACVLTDNSPGAIAEGVKRAHGERDRLEESAELWCRKNERYMEERIAALARELSPARSS